MSVLNKTGEDQADCPLCMEPLEVDDLHFYPCTCGYQICRFCWNRIREGENGLCPACRKAYPENPADFTPLSQEQVAAIKTEKRAREQKKKNKTLESRKALANVRVVQSNLVFVVGLPMRLADPEILKRPEYFGKYGKIHKVVINQSTTYAGTQGPSASAYVTYMNSADALRAIQSVNNVTIDGRVLKGSLGTTKYCANFMKNQPCPKADCMYLHEMGDSKASFTKEEMHQGLHQIYERSLHNALNAQMAQEAATAAAKPLGNGSANGGVTNSASSNNVVSSSNGKPTPSNSINIANGHKWKKEPSISESSSSDSSKDGWPSLCTSPCNTSPSNEGSSPESVSPVLVEQPEPVSGGGVRGADSKQSEHKHEDKPDTPHKPTPQTQRNKQQIHNLESDNKLDEEGIEEDFSDEHNLLEEQERLIQKMLDEHLLGTSNPHTQQQQQTHSNNKQTNFKETTSLFSSQPPQQTSENPQSSIYAQQQTSKQKNGMTDVQANMFVDAIYQKGNVFIHQPKQTDSLFGQPSLYTTPETNQIYANHKVDSIFTSQPANDSLYNTNTQKNETLYNQNRCIYQQSKFHDSLYGQTKVSDSLYGQPKLSDSLYGQQNKMPEGYFQQNKMSYGDYSQSYQPKIESNLYRNGGIYGATKNDMLLGGMNGLVQQQQQSGSQSPFNNQSGNQQSSFNGQSQQQHTNKLLSDQQEVRYGENNMDKFFNDFHRNLQMKYMNGVQQVLPKPPPSTEMLPHTLIESRLRNNHLEHNSHIYNKHRQEMNGFGGGAGSNSSRDDDLDFDPFKETQKGLAEMMQKEMMARTTSERATRAPPGFDNYNPYNVAKNKSQRQPDWTAMDPAIMSLSFNKLNVQAQAQAAQQMLSEQGVAANSSNNRISYPQMMMPPHQQQILMAPQQVQMPPGFSAPRQQQRNECIESK